MEHLHGAEVMLDVTVVARCRALLGDEAEGLSDREVDRIRQHAETMARLIVEIFLEQRATLE